MVRTLEELLDCSCYRKESKLLSLRSKDETWMDKDRFHPHHRSSKKVISSSIHNERRLSTCALWRLLDDRWLLHSGPKVETLLHSGRKVNHKDCSMHKHTRITDRTLQWSLPLESGLKYRHHAQDRQIDLNSIKRKICLDMCWDWYR